MLRLEIQPEKDVRDTGMVLKVSDLRIKFPVVDGTTCQNSIDARHCWMGQDFFFSLQRSGKDFVHLCSWDPSKSSKIQSFSSFSKFWTTGDCYNYSSKQFIVIFVISLSHNSVLAGLKVHTFLVFVKIEQADKANSALKSFVEFILNEVGASCSWQHSPSHHKTQYAAQPDAAPARKHGIRSGTLKLLFP